MVRNLLPASDVPEAYVDVFDSICAAGYKDGTSVGYEGVRKLMDGSGVSKPEQEAILKQVALNAGGQAVALGRPEFNVLLALIGLAQESEEATLDGVDERRKRTCSCRVHHRVWVLELTSEQVCQYLHCRSWRN